jgi:hypothetical protein
MVPAVAAIGRRKIEMANALAYASPRAGAADQV